MKRADVVVVGGGVFGLTAALALAERGRHVLVVDRDPGAGASGGLLGALAPFAPAPWSPKKAAQHDALLSAEEYWRSVVAASGIDTGYGRVGRILPLRSSAERRIAEGRAAAAGAHWRGGSWQVLDRDPSGLLAPDECPEGVVHETLSARLAPRAALRALNCALAGAGGATLRDEVTAVEPGRACLRTGGTVRAEAVVVAAGAESGTLLAPFGGPPVTGVKGQAVLLDAAAPAGTAIVADSALWVVPHAGGTVAVGSTSETSWSGPEADQRADDLVARARALCPWLRSASVLERWAGIRPRAVRPDPVAGPIAPGVFVATGGFKIGFGLAPVVAALVARSVCGEAVDPTPGVSFTQLPVS